MSLQAFVDTRPCGGCVHAYGIQLLAKYMLNVGLLLLAACLLLFCEFYGL